jgi:hypothetical protein
MPLKIFINLFILFVFNTADWFHCVQNWRIHQLTQLQYFNLRNSKKCFKCCIRDHKNMLRSVLLLYVRGRFAWDSMLGPLYLFKAKLHKSQKRYHSKFIEFCTRTLSSGTYYSTFLWSFIIIGFSVKKKSSIWPPVKLKPTEDIQAYTDSICSGGHRYTTS